MPGPIILNYDMKRVNAMKEGKNERVRLTTSASCITINQKVNLFILIKL